MLYTFASQYSPAQNNTITGAVFPNQRMPLPANYDFPIDISPDDKNALISRIEIQVNADHPNPSEAQIILIAPNGLSTLLFPANQTGLPPNINKTFLSSNTPSLKDLTALTANGKWTLRFRDEKEGNVGKLNFWNITIEPALTEDFNIGDSNQFLQLEVDGYGSFGDQGFGTNIGAQYQPNPDIGTDNTVFHSTMYLHGENEFLSSLDMYPGNKKEPVPLSFANNKWGSQFQIQKGNVRLIQETIRSATYDFTLVQKYTFQFNSPLDEPYIISRYLNSKLDPSRNSNYPALNMDESGSVRSLTIFNELNESIQEESTFLDIAFESDTAVLFGFQIKEWQTGEEFPVVLHRENLNIYEPERFGEIPSEFDTNNDGITDPGKGFDAALLLGIEIPAGTTEAEITFFTTWGFSSPSVVLQATDPIQTSTPTPMVPTLPPGITPSPTPTTAEPIPGNQTPRWIKRIPDLRFLQNQTAPNVLDLDEYVFDPDTPQNELAYSIISGQNLPFTIDEENRLSFGEVSEPRDYGFITVQASDGAATIAQNIRVKVSSVITKTFHQIPPIILQPGEVYQSTFSLDDLVFAKSGDQSIIWEPVDENTGYDVTILADDRFTITSTGAASTNLQSIPFIAQRGDVPVPTATNTNTPPPTATFTPTATNTPSPTMTFTPTSTNTQTATPTATNTPQPAFTPTPVPTVEPTATDTPTSTATQTPTPTQTNTPLPTNTPTGTPTPRATNTPSVTPSPSPTPTLGCSLAFNFDDFISTAVMTGPVEITASKNNQSDSQQLLLTHLDEGSIGIYDTGNSGIQETGVIPSQPGTANTILSDINNDGIEDVITLNVFEERLILYLSTPEGTYQQSAALPLNGENIVEFDATLNGSRYRGMTLEQTSEDSAVVVVRSRSSLLRVQIQSSQMNVLTRIPVDGLIRFIQSTDLDADGDNDLIVAVRRPNANEELFVYRFAENDYTLSQIIRVDTDFEGNFPRDVFFNDFNFDGRMDIGLLTFSNAIRIYAGQDNAGQDNTGQDDGLFTLLSESSPFPPGVVLAITSGDLDRNGDIDIAALHENQDGLNLFLICGNDPLQFTERKLIRVQNFVLAGQQYHLRLLDLNGDDDLDIIFTRSLFNDVITLENRER